jgi:hypothetical protein
LDARQAAFYKLDGFTTSLLAFRLKSQTKLEEAKITYDGHLFRIISEGAALVHLRGKCRAFHMFSRRMTSVLFVSERLADTAFFVAHLESLDEASKFEGKMHIL